MDKQAKLAAMLEQLDAMYSELFDMGETELANNAMGLSESIWNTVEELEETA